MPDFGIYAGDTSKTIYVRLRDSTTGLAKTGLVFNSAGVDASYTLPGAASVPITIATLASASAAWATGGFILVNDTDAKGLYRLDLPDASIASGDFTIISIEFDGIIEESILIPLHIRHVNVEEWLGTAPVTPSTAGVPRVDLTRIAGATTDVSTLATSVAAIKTTTDFLPAATAGAAGGVFIAGTNAATTITSAIGSALTLTSTGTNGSGLLATGDGTGTGIRGVGGATGVGIWGVGGVTSGTGLKGTGTAGNSIGIEGVGQGSSSGIRGSGGDTGSGIRATGGATSGNGISAEGNNAGHGIRGLGGSTSGHGVSGEGQTLGHGMRLLGAGSGQHGLLATSGSSGVADGISAVVAGGTGTPIRGDITGTITTVTTVDGLAAGIIDNTSVGTLDNTNFAFIDANERVDVGAWLGTAATSGTGGPDVNINAIGDSTAAAVNLAGSALGIVKGTMSGTPSTTVIRASDLPSAVNDTYIGRVIVVTSGAATGEATDITAYTGSTREMTVTALASTPGAADTFVIV